MLRRKLGLARSELLLLLLADRSNCNMVEQDSTGGSNSRRAVVIAVSHGGRTVDVCGGSTTVSMYYVLYVMYYVCMLVINR